MVTVLEKDKYYKINFINKFVNKGPYTVRIVGSTNKNNIHTFNESFELRDTFFDEVGFGTYLSFVDEYTEILICKVVKSYEPIELDDELIFIPQSIINYDTTVEFLIARRYNLKLESFIRKFDDNAEELEFNKNLESIINKAINTTNELPNDVLHVSTLSNKLLISKDILESDARERMNVISKREFQKRDKELALKNKEIELHNIKDRIERDMRKLAIDRKFNFINYDTITGGIQLLIDCMHNKTPLNTVKGLNNIIDFVNNLFYGVITKANGKVHKFEPIITDFSNENKVKAEIFTYLIAYLKPIIDSYVSGGRAIFNIKVE